jgi:hypothetical protein
VSVLLNYSNKGGGHQCHPVRITGWGVSATFINFLYNKRCSSGSENTNIHAKGRIMPVIKRFLSEKFLDLVSSELNNLLKIVNNSMGELDLSIRDDYLNLYFKGNSVAKISHNVRTGLTVVIHKKFFEGTRADNPEFYEEKKLSGSYVNLHLSKEKPALRLLQKAHIDQFCSRVKQVNYGEEIVFEQALITDNHDRVDLIIIDRQVTDHVLRGKRLDLLALEQIKPNQNKYRFLVIEVKLGNNPELKKDVAHQLDMYVQHITKHIEDYQKCYQKQYIQKKSLGLLPSTAFESISIVDEVKGVVVVGGYSKIALNSIEELEKYSPDIRVKLFEYKL